jgi:predicted RNA-binding protein with EMAP domain
LFGDAVDEKKKKINCKPIIDALRGKCTEYLKRAEEIRGFLDEEEEVTRGEAAAIVILGFPCGFFSLVSPLPGTRCLV